MPRRSLSEPTIALARLQTHGQGADRCQTTCRWVGEAERGALVLSVHSREHASYQASPNPPRRPFVHARPLTCAKSGIALCDRPRLFERPPVHLGNPDILACPTAAPSPA